MPIGGGILPASGSSQYNELTYVTRRAFIPKLVVQLYNSTPLMAALIANSQTASGGVSSVTVPVQALSLLTLNGLTTLVHLISHQSSKVLSTLNLTSS